MRLCKQSSAARKHSVGQAALPRHCDETAAKVGREGQRSKSTPGLDHADRYAISIREKTAAACLLRQVEYSPEELDALALLFTAVKVVYLGGAIGRAARLIELLEAARRASRKPLHTTLIRNEAAYFSCIAQLLREHPPPPPSPKQLRPLFLCGDSHTLSGGSCPPAHTAAAANCCPVTRLHAVSHVWCMSHLAYIAETSSSSPTPASAASKHQTQTFVVCWIVQHSKPLFAASPAFVWLHRRT